MPGPLSLPPPPFAPPARWRGWQNAEIYDAFVRRQGVYRWLNRHLAELAELATAHRVLDLACGTGATAEACLAALPRDAELVGVDAAEAMAGVARARVGDPRARFLVADAAAVAEAVTAAGIAGGFDRAVCNAAFWQFPRPAAVLSALARLLSPGALFVFNVPVARLAGKAATRADPFQQALARAVEAETGRPFVSEAERLDPDRLGVALDAAGFRLERRRRLGYRGVQRELMELMEVPAMIRPLTRGLSAVARRRVLERARERSDPERPVTIPWVFFVARREA